MVIVATPHDHLAELGDAREEAPEVCFLLVVGAEREPFLLADDGDHGLVGRLGVVQPVEQRDGAGGRITPKHAIDSICPDCRTEPCSPDRSVLLQSVANGGDSRGGSDGR
ncbi:hypothetical protein [Streptomyces sp. NPDC001056]